MSNSEKLDFEVIPRIGDESGIFPMHVEAPDIDAYSAECCFKRIEGIFVASAFKSFYFGDFTLIEFEILLILQLLLLLLLGAVSCGIIDFDKDGFDVVITEESCELLLIILLRFMVF